MYFQKYNEMDIPFEIKEESVDVNCDSQKESDESLLINTIKDENKICEKQIESEGNIKEKDTKEILKIDFLCNSCGLREKCDYHGRHPPFAKKINFNEDSYVMRDPFSPPPGQHSNKTNTEYFIVLGSHCFSCEKSVCKGPECSYFYGRTLCLECASRRMQEFPLEVQSKVRKQLANI